MKSAFRRTAVAAFLVIGVAGAGMLSGQGQRGGRGGGGAGAGAGAQAAPPAGQAPGQPGGLPDGEGKTIVNANCVGCHGLDQITGAKHNETAWTETIKRMGLYGADIKDPQIPLLAAYLAKAFPDPNAPKEEPKEDPLARGKKILETACTTCHDLGVVERRNDDRPAWESTVYGMVGNGADVKDADIPILVDYLFKTYGPVPATPAPTPAPAGQGGRGGAGGGAGRGGGARN